MSLLSSRLLPFRSLPTLSTIHPNRLASTWQGRQPEEHVTNRKDSLDVHASASKSGKEDRVAESSEQKSSATSEKDHGNQNERAQKDHPEAPGPVIGMNDERGQVSQEWKSWSHALLERRDSG